jgi:hypothetical protein
MDATDHIKVIFGPGFDGVDKGPFLLEMERVARRMLGRARAEVFMETMRDQNKPRQKLRKGDAI